MKQAHKKEGEFLLEIGTEEIPPSYLEEGLRLLVSSFKNLPGLKGHFTVEGYQTPRRIILHAEGLPVSSEKEEEIFGPKKEICYQSDGKPTPALEGFLKRHRASRKELAAVGGRIVLRRKTITSTRQILMTQMPLLISALSFPKLMRWGEKRIPFPPSHPVDSRSLQRQGVVFYTRAPSCRGQDVWVGSFEEAKNGKCLPRLLYLFEEGRHSS